MKNDSRNYQSIVNFIEEKHINAAKEALKGSDDILEKLQNEIKEECAKLRSFMAAAEIIEEISPKSRDVIISMGEKLSGKILTYILESKVQPS